MSRPIFTRSLHGADAYIATADGLVIVFEATGNEGGSQTKQELEPVARHLRSYRIEHPDVEALGLFVAPSIDTEFVCRYYGFDAFRDDQPAVIVPVTAQQLSALGAGNLTGFLRAAAALAPRLDVSARQREAAVTAWLEQLDELVTDHAGPTS